MLFANAFMDVFGQCLFVMLGVSALTGILVRRSVERSDPGRVVRGAAQNAIAAYLRKKW
jgi:hypothetical protein